MAIYKQFYYGDDGWYGSRDIGDAAKAKAFFDSFNSSLFETELINNYKFTINIDNTVLLTLDGSSSVCSVTSTYDGTTSEIGYIQAAGNKVFTVVCSDNFLYIEFCDYYPRSWYLCYEKIGSNKYYGTIRNDPTYVLSDITLTKLGTSDTFKHKALLNYNTNQDCIDYQEKDILFNSSNLKAVEDPNCIAISNKSSKQIITIDGNNYYTLSSNVAIILDS